MEHALLLSFVMVTPRETSKISANRITFLQLVFLIPKSYKDLLEYLEQFPYHQ